MIGLLRSFVFSISTDEASFVKRGFAAQQASRQNHLEHCASSFIVGYNAALRVSDLDELSDQLAGVDLPSRGFAYEGAGMGFALLDGLNPIRCVRGSPRFNRFLRGCGTDHLYMAYIGVGWAVARLPWVRRRLDSYVQQFDPLLRWLVYDGYGFHQGFFQSARFVESMERPQGLSHYGLRAFDQGLGRCLWFVHGGDVEGVVDKISRVAFSTSRRSIQRSWSGDHLCRWCRCRCRRAVAREGRFISLECRSRRSVCREGTPTSGKHDRAHRDSLSHFVRVFG